jgi:tubulin polyglutamylase TTLL2
MLTLLPLGEYVPKTDAKCFELYGFDILLDDTLKPWLIEVNFSPSLGGDSIIDQTVKEGLIEDVLDTLDFKPPGLEATPSEKPDPVNNTLESDVKYLKEYDRFLSRTPVTHREQAMQKSGVGNFDLIFPFNEETRDAANRYGDQEAPEVQQERIVQEISKKYGQFISPL